ncbi:MAG: hypothetical protein ACXW2E_00595 [Nitrososphaeraceae archaeon]
MVLNETIINQINNSKYKFVLNSIGCGYDFTSKFMSVPGASKSVISINMPYDKGATDALLGEIPTHYVSKETAIKLAKVAFNNTILYQSPSESIGIGITGSLTTQNERIGRKHSAYIAIQSLRQTYTLHIDLDSAYLLYKQSNMDIDTTNSRIIEDFIVASTLLELLQYIVDGEDAFDFVFNSTYITFDSMSLEKVQHSSAYTFFTNCMVIYPGSWNPFHEAHKKIYETAREVLSEYYYKPIFPVLELSAFNADKGITDYFEINNRVNTLSYPYLVTTASTFVDKVKAIKAHSNVKELIFILGADTWNRLGDPKYAGDVSTLFEFFNEHNVYFLVAGRKGVTIKGFEVLDTLRLKSKQMEELDMDHSSSMIRSKN